MFTRASAYLLAVNDGKILLTQLADFCTNAGHWGLPGGGIHHGEQPDECVVREVWEEAGLKVEDVQLVCARTFSEVSSRGDFLGVQLVYTAELEGEPRVLEVGGSTADVEWVPLEELANRPMLPVVAAALEARGCG